METRATRHQDPRSCSNHGFSRASWGVPFPEHHCPQDGDQVDLKQSFRSPRGVQSHARFAVAISEPHFPAEFISFHPVTEPRWGTHGLPALGHLRPQVLPAGAPPGSLAPLRAESTRPNLSTWGPTTPHRAISQKRRSPITLRCRRRGRTIPCSSLPGPSSQRSILQPQLRHGTGRGEFLTKAPLCSMIISH